VYKRQYQGDHIFLKSFSLNLGLLYIIIQAIAITGAANGTNLTDGLDGLVSVPTIMCMGFFIYSITNINDIYSHSSRGVELMERLKHLNVGELSILCGSIAGALTGFLWFNTKPAQIFMGDTGSLFLGSTMATISVITKTEVFLVVAGGIFVIETASVILQVGSFKLRGKRMFLMAPIHHHFERKGMQEGQIVVRFWITSGVFTCFAMYLISL
jgi:phospho-N-acetylmuramoyl-pentapeptide-transferase